MSQDSIGFSLSSNGSSSTPDHSSPLNDVEVLIGQGKLDEAMQQALLLRKESLAAEALIKRIEGTQLTQHAEVSVGLMQAFFPAGANGAPEMPAVLGRLREQIPASKSLKTAFSSLSNADQAELKAKVGEDRLSEILSISDYRDSDGFWQAAAHFGTRLKQNDQLQPAMGVLGMLSQGGVVPEAYRKQAETELNAIIGKGEGKYRAEFLVGQFAKQACDLKTIVPMIGGSAIFSLGNTAILGRLAMLKDVSGWWARGMGARALAGTIAFMGEVGTFYSMNKGMAALYGESTEGPGVGKELLGTAMTLGTLKLFGFLGNQAFIRAHGVSELGVATQLQGFSKVSQAIFPQVSQFMGMMASHKLEENLGLRPHVDGATTVMDTVSSLVSLGAGGYLGHKMLGSRYASFEKEMGMRANIYTQALEAPRSQGFGKSALEWLQSAMQNNNLTPGMKLAAQGAGAGGFGINMAASSLEPELPGKIGRPSESILPQAMAMQALETAGGGASPKPNLNGRYVVIANRGEPAVRAVQEAKKLGAIPVVYYSDADKDALHANMDGTIGLHLPGNTSKETYINQAARIEALERFLKETGLQAKDLLQWDGWGFLSEDKDMVAGLEELGIPFAGASSFFMDLMGDKVKAKATAERAGVRIVPGSKDSVSLDEAKAFGKEHGYPVIIKGKNTGGGKGIRVALSETEIKNAYYDAAMEAKNTSGSDKVFIEKFIPSMRHLELQVIGDGKGKFSILGIRDCTIQRRKQKVIEEDVSTFVSPETREQAFGIGQKLMTQLKEEDPKGVGYTGPGTIEIIQDLSDNSLYFMEMNTRLQVEHTVTEMVTKSNLLASQLLIGAGYSLDELPEIQAPQGHSIEARITAENPFDPEEPFRASTGTIVHFEKPSAPKDGRTIVRVDTGFETGRSVPQFYDSLLAKLVVWGPTRSDAVTALRKALDEFEILGIKTNIPFLRKLTATEEFGSGKGYDTSFIQDIFLASEAGRPDYSRRDEAVIAAAVQTYLKNPSLNQSVEIQFGGQEYKIQVYQNGPGKFLVEWGNSIAEVGLSKTNDHSLGLEIDGIKRRVLIHSGLGKREVLLDDGMLYEVKVGGEGTLGKEYIVAPNPSLIQEVLVAKGDKIEEGTPLMKTEAMKNITEIKSSMAGEVEEIFVKQNQTVEAGSKLFKIKPASDAQNGAPEAEVSKEPAPKSIAGFNLRQAPIRILSQTDLPMVTNEQRLQAQTWYQRFFEGYEAPTPLLQSVLSKLEPQPETGNGGKEEALGKESLRPPKEPAVAERHSTLPPGKYSSSYLISHEAWVLGLLDRYQKVEAVFQPANQRFLNYFLNTGKVENQEFAQILGNALKLYGVNSLEPSPALELARRRLFQSHAQRDAKHEILTGILKWVPRFIKSDATAGAGNGETSAKTASKPPLVTEKLEEVRQIYAGQVQTTFLTQVEETLARLRDIGEGAENSNTLEKEFTDASNGKKKTRDRAINHLLGRYEVILPFLLEKLRTATKDTRMALRLIQQRLYRNHYKIGDQREFIGEQTVIARIEGKNGNPTAPLFLVHKKVENLSDIQRELARVLKLLPKIKKKDENLILELKLPELPDEVGYASLEKVFSGVLGGHKVQRITTIVEDADGGDPDFRTFEPSAEGVFQENRLLRDIHPLHAQDIGLKRWTENFNLVRQDFGLFHNIHAYRATQKGMKENDSKADRRHIVIGEHSGKLTPKKFDANHVRNQLIKDFRALSKNPNTSLSEQSRVIWQWLPFTLRESGQLGKDFDPFSVGVLMTSPDEMIKQFDLNEAKLNSAASFYHGKVYSVPEAERVAGNTALVMKRLQDSYIDEDGKAKKLPALADIYIRQPIDISDDEVKLLAFRLTPEFMGQQLEKTTLHFKRKNKITNAIDPFIAEVKIPRGSRFEVTIKETLDAPAHAVKGPLERKRASQQSRGKLYVYDRVALFHDVIKDFYPQGNIPEDAVQIRELVLDKSGKLVPTDRPVGKNDIARVAFHVSLKMPTGSGPNDVVTREFAVVADDITVQGGSNGTKEGDIYKALADYAIEKGIPKLNLAETSGARLGLADEVVPFLKYDEEKKVVYVLEEDLPKTIEKKSDKKKEDSTRTPETKRTLADLVRTAEPYEVQFRIGSDGRVVPEREVKTGVEYEIRTEKRIPIHTILGEGEVNTESLNSSGKTGEAESRARSLIPTFTIVCGTVVGIGTYDARLSERVIMLLDSFLGLTGKKAINQTFGTNFKDESEIHGPEIMSENGVAYKIAPGERDAFKYFLQWMSYLPAKKGEEAVRFEISDSIDRDITPGLLFGVDGKEPVIKGKGMPYDTRLFDAALFDRGSLFYVGENFGRGVNIGYARYGGFPIGFITMQLKPEEIPGQEKLFGGSLDADDSFKVAQHIRNLNTEGLPLFFDASITGFMPLPGNHRKKVVPGGAKILDELRSFQQEAVVYIPPFGQLWGGAWVVIDKNINPNILMVADKSAAMGILGSAGAISVPKFETPMENDIKSHPELVALRERISKASGPEKEGIELAYAQAYETLKAQHYLPKWRTIIDAQNTALRAYEKGTIHALIENPTLTRPELFRLWQEKRREVQEAKARAALEQRQTQDILGALRLIGFEHQILPDGSVEISQYGGVHRFPKNMVLMGLQAALPGLQDSLIQSIMKAGKKP